MIVYFGELLLLTLSAVYLTTLSVTHTITHSVELLDSKS
jgi:hypothetical protein